jgi:hypothetical protein
VHSAGGECRFVCQMEDVLDVYHRPYDPQRPLVCLDEASRQWIGEVVPPLPTTPGQPARFDHAYVRNSTANLFMVFEPLLGWRAVQVTERRTAKDFAEVVRWLVEDVPEEAEKVVLVCDNLNTHKLASLYEAFPPEQARRIAERIEWHYTPKHGSWLNMAEIERSVLQRQALDRRIETQEQMARFTRAWEEDRNERGVDHVQRGQALVDDPGERLDTRPHQILLQLHRFMDRRGLRQRDDQHAGEARIAESGQQLLDRQTRASRRPAA